MILEGNGDLEAFIAELDRMSIDIVKRGIVVDKSDQIKIVQYYIPIQSFIEDNLKTGKEISEKEEDLLNNSLIDIYKILNRYI